MNGRPTNMLPLVRHLSWRVTPFLLRTPVTPNQITAASMVLGLACAWCLMQGTRGWAVTGAVLLVVEYVLDNCDGEVARAKNLCSEFGDRFDSFVDWLVHACFFAALGIGVERATGADVWLWLGWIGAAGTTINYVVGLVTTAWERRAREGAPASPVEEGGNGKPRTPRTLTEWAVFALRELSRADFCFIVLLLAVFDLTWLLLPAGAVGSQAYWIASFFGGAREYKV